MVGSKRTGLATLALLASALATTAAQAAPTANDDSYAVNVNGLLTVAAASGLLSNDTGFNAATHRLESTSIVSQYGARLTIAADGSFTYDPPAGFSGVDTFAYTVRSDTGAAAAVVTIDVTGQTVWFVDDSAAAGGDGSFGAPFNSFTLVNGSSGIGDVDAVGETIFVYAGTYSVEFDLEVGQQLLGEANGLDLIGTGNDIAPGVRPTLNASSSFPIIEFFGANGTVRGFNINSTAGMALQGASVSNVTVAQVTVTANAGSNNAILLNGSAGTNTFDNFNITGAAGTGNAIFLLSNSGTINFVGSTVSGFTGGYVLNINGNSGTINFDSSSDLTSSNTRGLTIQTQAATGVVNLAGVDLTGGAASEPLIRLQSNNAASTVNFLEGVTASTTTTDSAAFLYDGGRLAISGSTSVLSAADGAALYLESVTLTQNASFASVSSTGAPARGISIDSPIGTNDVIVSGTTTISTPTTEAIRVNSPAASGFLLQMATLNSTGGSTGIAVTNAAVTVSNSASTLVTSAGPAVVCATSTANLALTTLTAAGGTTGVSFDGCTGTVNAAGGTLNSTAGAGNPVVNLISSAGTNAVNFTYGGSINKTTSGAAVNIVGLTTPGAATFSGTVTATNASSGVVITTSTRPVTFTTLALGSSGARFAATPITLADNTGAVNLGTVSIYTDSATGLNVNYANAGPGMVSTSAGSLLNVSGNAAALVVNHATSQTVSLQFASITNTGGGTHGININRATGVLFVSGLTNVGAKTTAGVQISNSNNFGTSLSELDITGAFDGVRLSDLTGSSFFDIIGDGNFINVNSNGFGGTFSNLGDNAFDLTNVPNFRANDVTVNGTGSHGVTGSGVSGTTVFSNVDFSNIGNADNEHVFNFQEGAVSGAQVSGTLDINNSVIDTFTDTGVYLENFAGTLNFSFANNVLRNNITTTACGGGNCNGNGILLRADGTSRINALILNGAFENIDGIGLTANPEGNSGARMDIKVAQSAFTAAPYAGTGHTNNGETAISLRNAQGNSTLNFNLSSNDIRNYTGELALGVVEVEGGDFTTTNGVIDVLYIYHANDGNALQVFADGDNTAGSGTTNFTMNVSMNAVNVPATTPVFGSSILLQNSGAIAGSNVNANYLVTNSSLLANATGTSRRTLTMNARDSHNVCTQIQGNTIAAGTGGTVASIALSYNGTGNVRLQGMSGSGNGNAISYLGANNTLSVAAESGPNVSITSATCTVPTLPVGFPF